MIHSEEEYSRMAEAEQALWWYRCLHALVLDRIKALRLPADAAVVDAGCGTGGLMLRLREAGYRQVRGFDISPFAVAHCEQRGLPVRLSSVIDLASHVMPHSLSLMTCNDVLYFLPSQQRIAAFSAWRTLLDQEGRIILNVPTGNLFRGIHDLSVGIGERISLAQLQSDLHKAGYEIEYRRYWPFLLSPLVLAARFSQRLKLRKGEADIRSDIDLPPVLVNQALYALTRLETRLPIGWFGSSLFVVARPRLTVAR
jgi:SAM-dependent methyltransferase